MSVISDIKAARVSALKNKQKDVASFLSFVIGSLEAIGKNAGNRETTDDEAIAAIKKIIQKNNEILEVSKSEATNASLSFQNEILELYLPQMVSEDDLRAFINSISLDNPNKGLYMKEVKAKYGQSVDMKLAGKIIDEKLSD